MAKAKVVSEPKMKVYQAKKKVGDFSLYSNLNTSAKPETQTVSKKSLIRGILHGCGIGQRVMLGDPIKTLDTNINLLVAQMKKEQINPEIINTVTRNNKSYQAL